MRVFDAVCLALAVGVAGYVYNVKHEAEVAQDAKRALEREIAIVSRDVHLLEADLAALDHPGRLQAVVRGLGEDIALEPIAARHFIRLTDIPFRSDLITEADETADGAVPVASVAEGNDQAPSVDDGIASLLANGSAPERSSESLDALLNDILAPARGDVPDTLEGEPAGDGIAALLEGQPIGLTP